MLFLIIGPYKPNNTTQAHNPVFPTLRNQKKIEKEEIEKPHPAKPPVIVPRPHNDVRRQMLPSLRRFSRKSGCRSQN
jgi:hypothetical protein